jgi:hypothetical protein
MAPMMWPAWTLTEMQPGEWWAADTSSGTAFLLRAPVAEQLWRNPELQRQALSAALGSRDAPKYEHFVDVEFLGVLARYYCKEPHIADQIRQLYESMLPELRRSPDVLVELDHDVDFDRIHRSVDGDRKGVRIQVTGTDTWFPGSSNLPALPLMQCPGLGRRFCGLHAALLGTGKGGLLVCGEQKMGKTSAAMLAPHLRLASLLGDETVLIDHGGKAYSVPLPVRERSDHDRSARALPKVEDQTHAIAQTITDIILLDRCEGPPSWTQVIPSVEKIRLLTPHMRMLDGPLGQATRNLLILLRNARVWNWQLRPWPGLAEDLEHGLRRVIQ